MKCKRQKYRMYSIFTNKVTNTYLLCRVFILYGSTRTPKLLCNYYYFLINNYQYLFINYYINN